MRPGEKLHEQLISADEASYTYEFQDYYKILSPLNEWDSCVKRIQEGEKVKEGFTYTSDKNRVWLKNKELANWLRAFEKK